MLTISSKYVLTTVFLLKLKLKVADSKSENKPKARFTMKND